MRRVLVLSALLMTGAASAQTGELRVFASASDPFTIELPRTFVYGTEAEVAPGKRVHLFQELQEGGRLVSLDTDTALTSAQKEAYVDGAALRRSLPQWEFTEVALSTLPLPEGLAGSAASAFTFVRDRGDTREVGYIVRGCDDARCFSLGVGGPDRADADGTARTAYASLLSGFRFTETGR